MPGGRHEGRPAGLWSDERPIGEELRVGPDCGAIVRPVDLVSSGVTEARDSPPCPAQLTA